MDYILGVDLGSRSTKCVIIDRDCNMLGGVSEPSGIDPDSLVSNIIFDFQEQLNIKRKDIKYIVSTGYGRESLSCSNKQITEITCHGAGAGYLFPGTRTVVDIGGQDSKVIAVNQHGKPFDFVMNDKCAAGTGKFLEMMCRTLAVSLDELSKFDEMAKKNISINSICTVFAESEVISLMAEKETKENIIKGLHRGVAERTAGLVERVGLREEVTMTGGVARNTGVVRAIEKNLNIKLNVPQKPELTGAFGAAILGLRKLSREGRNAGGRN